MKCRKRQLLAMAVLTATVVGLAFYLSATGPRGPAAERNRPTRTAITNRIYVRTPEPNQAVSSPLVIEGMAHGGWFFEGDFPITLLDSRGNILVRSFASAMSEWMTDDLVPFRAQLEFTVDDAREAVLMLHKNNPAGLAQYDDRLALPVVLTGTKTLTVKVFFSNDRLDPEVSGDKVFAVERRIPRTLAVARGALEELLKGPTEKEAAQNYSTNINSGVRIQRLVIENGVATVDFDERLQYQVGGACRVSAIRAQITHTLKQFPAVDKVVISVNGRTEDILQP